MNEKEKKIGFLVFFLLALALIFAIGDALWQRGTVRELRWQLEHRDTTKVTEVRTDTIPDTIPKIAKEKQVGVLKVPVNDILSRLKPAYSTKNVDIKQKEVENSAYNMMQPTSIDTIELPKVQRVYSDDSTYRAWVSGYEPRLDSIEVYRKTIKETVTITIPTKKKRTFWQRFNIGIQAGYGLGLDDKKAHPYLGGGVGFNF
jgi:hypothetical protein